MTNLFIDKGNLGGTPSLKHVDGKNGEFVVANMRVMFGRYKQTEAGEIEQSGGFWREVELYGYQAEQAAKLLRKGARVLVVGQEREYTGTDDQGNKVEVFKIVADDVAPLLSRIESITFTPPRGRSEEAPAGEMEPVAG